MRFALLGLVLSVTVSGQAFGVATVKPAAPSGLATVPTALLKGPVGNQLRFRGGPGTSSPERIDYVDVSLKDLLARAYNVNAEQVAGLGWLDEEHFDVAAVMAPGTTLEQMRLMLQNLLTERFQITMHRDTKTLRVYSLTVAKGGHKLKQAAAQPEFKDDEERKAARLKAARGDLEAAVARRQASGPFNSFRLPSAEVARFVLALRAHLDRPVVDRTGLEGLYLFTLDWVPVGARSTGDSPSTGPSIFAALEEQLGLHLQPENEQSEILVIDKAERVPTSN